MLLGDLSKLAKDISEANKLTKKVNPPYSTNSRGDKYGERSSHGSSQGNKISPILKREVLPFFRQKPFLQTKKEKGRRDESAAVKMPEVCDKNVTLSNGLVPSILSILKLQTLFQAAQLHNFFPQWKTKTTDPTILQFVSEVKVESRNSFLPTQQHKRPRVFNTKQDAIVKAEINKLLAKGVIIMAAHEMGEFIITIFLRPKKDGVYHTILSLKEFNEFIAYHHFKMDTLEADISMMKPGCFMASVDLKDAYYTVPIHPSHQKYLKFCFNGVLYQYTCLPNGLASAPRIFTKLVNPVYATPRSIGHLNSG